VRARPLLILAHPGHELLLHQWLVERRPVVCVLTDGSGGAGQSRIHLTRRTLDACGARPGSIFGDAPDEVFYDAVLAGDVDYFLRLVGRIEADVIKHGADLVVSDAVEHFNPIHDLCSVVASLAALAASRRCCRPVSRCVFPIEMRPEGAGRALTARQLERKCEAIRRYDALSSEAERFLIEKDALLAREHLDPSPAELLPAPPGQPFYEAFGRKRVRQGRYVALIRYEAHVKPLVAALDRAVGRGKEARLEPAVVLSP